MGLAGLLTTRSVDGGTYPAIAEGAGPQRLEVFGDRPSQHPAGAPPVHRRAVELERFAVEQRRHPVDALLFDLGGVVIDIDFDRAFRHWAEASKLSLQEIRDRFTMDADYEQHERGELEASEYFAYLRQTLELDGDDEAIARGWNAIFVGEISDTVDAILAVRERIPCYALTNSNPSHRAVWTQAYPRVVSAFRHVFVSSQLGLRKPERSVFDAIAEKTGVRLESMLFFDDTLENVAGARACGLRAVHVREPSDVHRAQINVEPYLQPP